MKKILLLLLFIFLVGCTQEVVQEQEAPKELPANTTPEPPKEEPVEEPAEKPKEIETIPEPLPDPIPTIPTKEETIQLCDSLCKENEKEYCQTERSFKDEDKTITGTCRAFAKKGNVAGFSRCIQFCKTLDKADTKCIVDGKEDRNCDGVVG